jgi:hypothetical protein
MRLCTSHWIATYRAGAATWDDWVGTSSCPLCGGVLQSYRSCNSGGLATSGEYLQLHNRLPWKPWRPLLERTHDCCLPRRLRRLAHKCTSPPLLNDVTSLPPDHSNSHPLFLYKPGPPWPIEMTKRWTMCPVLLLCFPTPPSLVPPLLWAHVSLPAYVHWTALLLHSPRMPLCQHPHAPGEPVIIGPLCSPVSSGTARPLFRKLALRSSRGFRCRTPKPLQAV